MTGSSGETLDESWFREGAGLIFVPVREEVCTLLGGVDAQVVVQGFIRISGAWVRAPAYVFTLQRGCLGLWDVEDGDFKAVRVALGTEIGGTAAVTCWAGEKASRRGTRNSPTRAAA